MNILLKKGLSAANGLLVAGALTIGALTSTLATPAYADESITLRFSELGPPRGARGEAIIWWAEQIAERTEGRVKIEVFWSQSLVKAKDTLKAVGSGLTDAGSILGVYTPADVPLWNLANAPFGGEDPWVGLRTWQEMREKSELLRNETQSKNVKILVGYTTGPIDLISNKPIRSTADLKGMKMRLTGGLVDLMKNLGAIPVALGFAEYYQALDRGTVDGGMTYIDAAEAFKHYEVASNITVVQMGQVLGYGIGINLRTFNELPEEDQKIIEQVSDEMIDHFSMIYFEAVKASTERMSAGIDGNVVTFETLDPAVREEWRAQSSFFVEDWIEDMAKRGIDGEAFVAQVNEIRAKYEKELADKGYPWER